MNIILLILYQFLLEVKLFPQFLEFEFFHGDTHILI